jgi:soluble lytic murein transglycosylase-like protein
VLYPVTVDRNISPIWTRMSRHLQIAPMASLTAISFLFFVCATMPVWAQSGQVGAITSTDESGRRIYVNDDTIPVKRSQTFSATRSQSFAPSRSPLVYWSSTDHRFKPVPTSGATMRAARSAATEVSSYLDGRAQNHPFDHHSFTQQDIDAAIDESAARHHVDPSLVRSVVKVESNFNPNAVSRKGAMGLMQLMPATARSLNLVNPFDPAQNVDAGVRHLKQLLDSYGGNVRLSLAAYNAGAGAVARSAGVPHFRETQDYVRRITGLYSGGAEMGQYFTPSPIQAPVHVQRDARGVLYISNTD